MKRRALLLHAGAACALMSGASLAGSLLRPNVRMADQLPPIDLDKTIPDTFGEWHLLDTGVRTIVNPQTHTKLADIYSELLSRTYVNDKSGRAVMLSIAYGREQSDSLAVHLPDICYPSQGFELREVKRLQLDVGGGQHIPARRLITAAPQRPEPVTYWTTVGGLTADGSLQRKLAQMHYGVHGVVPDGLVFRVSSVGDQYDAEFLAQQQFVQALLVAVPASLRVRLVGSPT